MFQKNELLKVRDDHPFHAGKIGKFDFMGGPEADVLIMEVDRNHNSVTLIGVDPADVSPVECIGA